MSKAEFDEYYTCTRKENHGNEKIATKRAIFLTEKFGQMLPYPCRYCEYWHVGSVDGENSKRRWRQEIRKLNPPKFGDKIIFPHPAARYHINLGAGIWIVPQDEYDKAIATLNNLI